MGKYQWHVTVKGHKPEIVRHYKHLTIMYRFILRSHRFLGGKMLTIYCNDRPIIDISYDEVVKRYRLGLKEGEERSLIRKYGEKQRRLRRQAESRQESILRK